MLAQLRSRLSMLTRKQKWIGAGAILSVCVVIVVLSLIGGGLPRKSSPLEARLELAAGEVTVAHGGGPARVHSGAAVLAGSKITAGSGARALLRLSDGSALFLRGDTTVELLSDATELLQGEVWFEAPPAEEKPAVLRLGDMATAAANSGLSVKRSGKEVSVYVARGLATLTGSGGRVEIRAGELAVVSGGKPPAVRPVSYWEDWTGGMADQRIAGGSAGAGRVYGVDYAASAGRAALPLEVTKEAVRVTLQYGIAETEVDQTFFNPGERDVEGWYWLTVPENAIVTGFAVENRGVLVEGELIERTEAARQYASAAASGYEPALLEWIDGRSFRARVFPVPARGMRRVVTRYLELTPLADERLRYLFPLRSDPPVRIGEFSLSVDLGKAGKDMELATLEDARVEDGGQRVTMRRSGFLPNADFVLEAKLKKMPPAVRAARLEAGAEKADFLMLRYVPDVDWTAAQQPPGAVVVVVDTSAGIDDSTRQVQAAAAEAILRALADKDQFALMALDVRPEVLYPEKGLAAATDDEITKARERLSAHVPGGATDLRALFDVALARLHGTEQPAVIYIGDGVATSGEIAGDRLQAALRRSLAISPARLFTVAVGGEANQGFLDALARAGGGKGLRIGSSEEAGSRALELVAALKTPTVTDFELDAGAGLDQVFSSADGKVSWGGELVILARSHHDLPATVKVRGRLGGKRFEKSYPVYSEEPAVAGLVPRFWAAASMRRLLGEVASPEEQRGTIAKLGTDYGLMTPFTSFLALESEAAYAAQGISRGNHLGSARLSMALSPDASEERKQEIGLFAKMSTSRFRKSSSAPPPSLDQAMPSRPSPAAVSAGSSADVQEMEPGAMAQPAEESAAVDSEMGLPAASAKSGLGGIGTASRRETSGPRRAGAAIVFRTAACSDASQRPLHERALLWDKRLRTATAPGELAERYRSAMAACEMPDWRAESLFIRLLAKRITHESSVAELFALLASRPEARFYLARVLLRKNVGETMLAAIERLLFGDRVAWEKVDLELSAMSDLSQRIVRLKEYLARAPDDPAGGMRLVQLLARANRTEEALLFSRKLRQGGLLTPRLAMAIGDLLAESGQTDEAIRIYSEIVEYDPRNLAARRALGDVYLAHGWYDLSYAQYGSLVEMAPDDLTSLLRLASAAAGAGRTDEALRLERKVARAPASPGASDPRRLARLASAARLAGMMSAPGGGDEAKRLVQAMGRELAELQLFPGSGKLVVLTWENLGVDLTLKTAGGKDGNALGETTDGAAIGLAAILVPSSVSSDLALQAHVRNAPPSRPVNMSVHTIAFDGKVFKVATKRVSLPAAQSDVAL